VNARFVAAVSGALFAVGLALSGMTDPGKVLGFLDVAGAWDPSLAFVMGGAVGLHFLWLRFGSQPSATSSRNVDARLVGGAAIFGVGWGLSGYCPGPALTSLAFLRPEAIVFTVAMLAGILVFRLTSRPRLASESSSVEPEPAQAIDIIRTAQSD
jgi:uncharacterized protein